MKKVIYFFVLLFISTSLYSQIYDPEGLNMPGGWDGWNNPPTIPAFASSTQAGGNIHLITGLATTHYQTIFSTPTDVPANTYQFKFSSGPSSNYWQNEWDDANFTPDTIVALNFNGSNNDTVTLNDNKYYVMNWDNLGYENTRAIFMELSDTPVYIISTAQNTYTPAPNQAVDVKIVTNSSPCAEQLFYIRYTIDNWTSSQLVPFSFNADTGIAQIPGQLDSTVVSYYIFSTSISNPSSDFDLITINFDNDSSSNYSYNVIAPDTLSCNGAYSVLTTDPVFPLQDGSVTITFDATLGNGELAGYTGDVYAHTGVITSLSTDENDWRYVKTNWGENTPETKFTNIGQDLYQLQISNIRTYYGVPSNEDIYEIAMVIRSDEPISPEDPNTFYVARNADGSDFHLQVYDYGLAAKIIYPYKNDPLVPSNSTIAICAYAMAQTNFSLSIDDSLVYTTTSDTIKYGLNTGNYSAGMHEIIVDATDGTDHVYDTSYFYIRPDVEIADLPAGVHKGINYIDPNTVTLVLWDPAGLKNFAFVIGDFNNWMIGDDYYMKKTPDGKFYWITLTGLNPGQEYAYQYYIDGELKIADPYSHKILDPWNDKYIPDYNYPNLIQYPFNKTKGTVSVFQTNQTSYDWQITDFTPTAINETQPNLVIYELLIRDFVSTSAIKDVEDKLDYLQSLGVNAIELMPFNEFEGNISWGYNPDFYFAPDKYYGTEEAYKHFIDACHQRGIAVIMDIVFNHSFSLSPLVQMYFDKSTGKVTADNPWYNVDAPHPLSPGYDFNHESQATKEFVKEALNYWLTEYKIDGFRFDLSKGFTQTYTGDDVSAWSNYDQSRVDIWNDYYSYIKSVNSNAYVILEHLASNDEEQVLANAGMLLWGNMNDNFSQASMGWSTGSDFSWAYYANRGYTYPNLIAYPESHDEERIMYKNLTYGNSSGGYDITELNTALDRMGMTAAFYLGIPGPKMIWQFGEMGYDYSIDYCEDGTISEDCRTSPKPVRWDYWDNTNRQEVFATYQNMINLKNNYPAFRLGTFSYDLSGTGKREWISSDTFNVCIDGNFDVTGFDMAYGFQHTGTWYDLFNQSSINVTDVNMTEYFDPGEFHVFTDVYIPLEDLPFGDTVNISSNSVDNVAIFPNPAQDYMTIKTNQNYKITIYDITGKAIFTKQMKSDFETINIANLKTGVYIINLKNGKNSIIRKLVKK